MNGVLHSKSEASRDCDVQKGIRDFKTMMDKGVRVTADGCMLPHEQYGSKSKGGTLKGYHRSCYFFTGRTPARAAKTAKGKLAKGGVPRDKHGWPTDSQVTHLCHRSDCVRPDHLQHELRVSGQRRMYCGILGKGGCDCGMWPPCVRMFHPPEWGESDIPLCQTAEQVKRALAGVFEAFDVELLDTKTAVANARKAENAFKRKRAADKCAAATKKTKL